MSINFQEILKELEYRVEHGIIDLTKEEQVTKLAEILKENGVSDANEMAQKARVYFSYINEIEEANPVSKVDKILQSKVRNTDTGNDITVQSALQYKNAKNKGQRAAYGQAVNLLKKAGVSDKDLGGLSKKTNKPTAPKANITITGAEKNKLKSTVQSTPRIDKNVRNSIKQFENFLTDKQKLAIKLSQKQRTLELKKLDTLAQSFNKLPKEVRNAASEIFAKGQIYEGRENSGIGKNRLGYLDVKTLNSNRNYLIKAYGDGSPENIKKFVRGARKIKVTEEYVESSFNLLPESLQTALNGKGKTGDNGKNRHFLGYVRKDGTTTSDQNDPNIKKDRNGNLEVKRGNPGNRDRGKFVWRCILEQGGQDAYTGLPLDLSSIDLEHVCAFDNKDKGQPSTKDYLNREHDNNIVIVATNVNQKKSNLSMKKFYETHVNPQVGKSQAAFKKETQTYETINEVASQTNQKAGLIVNDGKIKKGYNFKTLKNTFDNDDAIYLNAKNEFKKVAETDEDRKAIEGLNSEIGKSVLMAMGLGRGIIDKSGRRTIKLSSDNLYRGFLLSMADAPNAQDKYKAAWENARKIANSDKFRKAGKGQQAMIKYLIDKKFISKNVLNDPKLGKVFKNALMEVYDYDNNRYILI
jgi:hypothetical protein